MTHRSHFIAVDLRGVTIWSESYGAPYIARVIRRNEHRKARAERLAARQERQRRYRAGMQS